MSTPQRGTVLFSTFAAGTVFAGAAIFGGVPAAPVHTTGLLGTVQHEIQLTSAADDIANAAAMTGTSGPTFPTFQQSMVFLLNNMLGIGTKTPGQLFDPNNTTTLDSLLGGSSLSHSSTIGDLFNALGLQNINLSAVLFGLNPSDTLTALMTTGPLGSLGGLTLNGILTGTGGTGPLPDGVATTVLQLVDKVGMGTMTLPELLGMLGIQSGATMDNLFTGLGIGGLEGFLPLMGLAPGTDLVVGIDKLTGGALGATTTLDGLMGSGGLLSTVGTMTLGQLLGVSSTDTLATIVGNVHWTDPGNASITNLGQVSLADILGWLTLDPSKSIAWNLDQLPMGLGGATTLGASSLASFLQLLEVNPTGTAADGVTHDALVNGTTTVQDFLDSMLTSSNGATPPVWTPLDILDLLGLGGVTPWV
jgi:hypothetical protein